MKKQTITIDVGNGEFETIEAYVIKKQNGKYNLVQDKDNYALNLELRDGIFGVFD